MATNIEKIFRSFVVTKFREIQEQQFGSGKIGNQHNGEVNTSGQVNSSDDTVQSIESLQNESLVQKIEQVLSEVLGTEPRYKSGDGEDIERNNSRSTKRGLSEEVQDEIPRKKSKKDKKHKDKKKKKKRKKEKKEKKYKKHAKEIDVQQKECGDMQLISHSNLENSGSLLNAENDMDIQSGSTLKEVSTWINEKTAYENLNSSVLNNVFSSDTSKLDTSEEDSTLINIQEVIEVKLTNDKELENDTCQSNVTVNICTEDEFLSGAVCTVVEGVSDIKEIEQAKLMLEATDKESVPETSPHCVIQEPEHLETRVESAAVEVTSINSVTESVTSKSLKQTVPTSFETTGYKLMTLPLESNVEAKDSVTTLGFLAMVVGKDFEATSEFLNTAKVKASERSPKHTSRKGDPVHDSEKTVTVKDLHKPLSFGTERKDLETAPEAVHAIPEKDFEPAVVAQLKPQQKVSEFDVQKYSRASLGTEILTEMKEFREPEVSTLMMELSESEKTARYLPIQRDAKDLKRAPLLENMTRIDSEEHLSAELLERKNLDVASDFMEIDTKCLRAKSDGVTESENWNTVLESLKAKEVKNLEYPQEFEKAEQINYLETSLETAIENRGNSEITQRSLALFNVKVPENTSQLKGVNVSETMMETEIVKTQSLEGSKYVDLRNKENENVEKWKNIPESLMTVNNLENTSSELQCIEEIKIVKETSQSDTEAQKKDFKTGLEPEGEREKRDVDAGSESLQMIFANYSEHSLELYTETEGMMELKNSEAVLKSLHKQDADNFESLCTKEIKYIKNTESEAMTGANDLQENLKPLHKHVKNVETTSESIALPIVTCMETVQGTSNRKRNETESHFVQEVEQKCSDSTDFVKKNQTGAEATDLGLISRYKEVIKTDSRRIRESELLSKSQGPLFISKSLHEMDVISSEKNQSKGIAVVQDLKESGKSLAAAIDPKEFFKLKNVVSVESEDDFPFGSTVKQFESVSESLEQNLELLEHTKTHLRKVCLDSMPDLEVKRARTSSEILYSDEFHIQEEKQKLEEKIETTGLMEATEPVHLSERDLIVPTSDSATIDSEYGPESMYLAETNSENILKSYKIQVKDSKTTSESMIRNVKDLKIDSEPLLQAGVEIREYLLGHKSVLTSDSVQLTPETPRKNEMLPESQSISGLPKSGTMLRSEGLTHAHLKTPPACIRVMDTEVVEITPKSKEFEVIEKQEGVLTSLFASVESTDVLEESFERMYTTDVNKVEASQKSLINVESIGKEKMNDEHIQPINENDANISETFMSSKHTVRAQIIEDILSAANKENVSVITPESSGELVLKYSEVSETITGLERENCDTTLPEFMVDVQDLEESSSILDAGEMKNLKTIQIENYAKSLRALESGDAADLSQSGSKVEPKSLRKTMSYERLLEIKDPVATAVQLKTPASTSSESVSILEVTDTSKISELKTSQTYLGVSDVKSSGTTAEKYLLEIIDSDSQMQAENILEVKHTESSSEIKYGLRTHSFKTASESEKVTQDKVSKTISDILCSGSVENLEQILESKHNQEGKDLDSHQFATLTAKDLKGGLTYEEIIGISETTTQFSSVVEATDTGSNISSIVPETVGKCPEIFLENINVSDTQGTNTNVELDNLLKQKSPEVTTDVKNLKPNSESNNAVESVHMKDLEDFEGVAVSKSVAEIKNLQVVQTSGDKEQMDFQELSKSVLPLDTQDLERNSSFQLLPQQKKVESSLEPIKEFVSVSECLSTKDIEQNLKCVSVAEGKAQESTVEHVILRQDKSAEIIPQFTLEVKDSEATLESLCVAKRKDMDETAQTSSKEQATVKPPCMTVEDNVNQLEIIVLGGSEEAVKPVHLAEKEDIKVGEYIEAKDSETSLESEVIVKDKDLEASLQDSSKYQDSDATLNSSDIIKESEGSNLRDKKSEKISSKSKDKSKSGKKAKKSRSKSPSKSKKRKKKSRSRSTSRQVSSRRARSRSKNDSSSKRKHSTSRHKSRSKSVDKKEEKESSLRSRRRRSRTSDRVKSRSKSADRRETSIRSRRRRSRSSDHKSRSRSVDKRESARRRRRLSRSSDNRRSRSRSADRRETLTRSRRRRSRSSDRHKSRSRSGDKRETSVRTRRRRSQSSDTRKSRSRSVDRRESSIRTRRRRSRSSDNHKSRSRSPDDKREPSVRTRRRRSRTPDTRKSRSRSVDRREISGRGRRRRSRSSDNHKSRSVSVDKRESSARIRRRRSRSSDNRRSKSKSVDKRETSVRMKRRRSVSSDRKSRSRSVDKRETSARSKRRRSRSSDNHKSRSKSVENIETAAKSKRRRSKSTDHKSRTKSVEKGELTSKSRHRRSKSSDRPRSKSKSRSKSSERRKDKDSLDGSRGKRSKYRSKSKSLEKTDGTDSLEATLNNREKSAEQHKSKSRSRSKSIDKTGERERLRRSRSKGSKSSESRSRRRRTVSRSRRNRSRSLTRKRTTRSKSDHRSQSRSRTRSRSCSRRWRRTRSRSVSRQRSLSRKRHRRSRRNRSRSTDRRRRRSDSRDSYRISLRLRSRSRTPARLRCSRSTGRRRSTSKSPDHRRSRSSSRSPKRLTDLDKAQLLEIAKANAAAMCAKAGVPLPPSLMPVITPEKKEEKVTQKSAKETILELTEKCKKIAQSQEDDVIVNKPHVSDEEEEEHPFINHPFKLNEPKPIFFNLTTPTIKPAAPKNQVTLTKEFPVSSGSQHRKKEADSAYGEWVPVEKNKDENKDDVFPNPANLEPVDISSALNERTIAQKRLTENTFDLEAMCLLNRAQERIDAWAELNSIPGHFTGSTGAQVLSSEQLSNSGPQAWVKKGQICLVAAFLPRSMPALLFTTLRPSRPRCFYHA
ncbi:protein SON isoform 2-T3 [Liasis olivaceus]